MPQLPVQVQQCPAGMDDTSDPVAMAPSLAQALVNIQLDQEGFARGSGFLIPVATTLDGSISLGIAWYYQALINNSDLPPFLSDALIIFTADGPFYALPTYSDLGVLSFGEPQAILQYPVFSGGPWSAGLYAAQRVRSVNFVNELCYVQDNGSQPRGIVFNSSGIYSHQLGINANQDGPGLSLHTGNFLTGTYGYSYTYYDHNLLQSSPSPEIYITPAGQEVGATVNFTPIFARSGYDPQVAGIYLYRTLANSDGVLYRVANIPFLPGDERGLDLIVGTGFWIFDPTAANDTAPDTFVQNQPVMPGFGENDPPNPASWMVEFQNRLICNDMTDPYVLQVSNLLTPTQWSEFSTLATDGTKETIGTDQGDVLTGATKLGSILAIFKRRSVWFLWGDSPQNFNLRPVHTVGCISTDSAVRCGDFLMYLGNDFTVYQAAYSEAGNTVTQVSRQIQNLIQSYTQAQLQLAFGWYFRRVYYLSIADITLAYNFDTQGWSINYFGGGFYDLPVPGAPAFPVSPVLIPPPVYVTPTPGMEQVTITASILPFTLSTLGPESIIVTFAIPAGFTWVTGVWQAEGTISLLSGQDGVDITSTGNSITLAPTHMGGSSPFIESAAATTAQMVDINAAVGTNMQVTFSTSTGATDLTITNFQLILTGS